MPAAASLTPLAASCTDHELVSAVRRGSDRAFEQLYGRYRGRISAYIFGLVGDHARSEDIAQEVFISALRRLRDTERPVAFRPWIYEIAKNACIDEFRRTRRAREVPLEPDEEQSGPEFDFPSRSPGPDAAVESKQSLADLRGAFRGLSELHHKIIVMRELEGLSYEQIGAQLGMTHSMVESALFRARKRLSEEYDDLVSGRRCLQVQAVIDGGGGQAVRKLGLRQSRQVARHLAHCQACRRHAKLTGFDQSELAPRSVAGKIAALLPIPWLGWRRPWLGGGSESLGTLARLGDTFGSAGLGRAVAAAAAVAAGIGGGGVVVALNQGASHPGSGVAARSSDSGPRSGARRGSGGVSAARSGGALARRGRSAGAASAVGGRGERSRASGAGTTARGGASGGSSSRVASPASAGQGSGAASSGAGASTTGGQLAGASSTLAGSVATKSSTLAQTVGSVRRLAGQTAGSTTTAQLPVKTSSGTGKAVSGVVGSVTGSLPKVTSGAGQGSGGSGTPSLPAAGPPALPGTSGR